MKQRLYTKSVSNEFYNDNIIRHMRILSKGFYKHIMYIVVDILFCFTIVFEKTFNYEIRRLKK